TVPVLGSFHVAKRGASAGSAGAPVSMPECAQCSSWLSAPSGYPNVLLRLRALGPIGVGTPRAAWHCTHWLPLGTTYDVDTVLPALVDPAEGDQAAAVVDGGAVLRVVPAIRDALPTRRLVHEDARLDPADRRRRLAQVVAEAERLGQDGADGEVEHLAVVVRR